MQPLLIVHGGAWNIPPKLQAAHLRGCAQAVRRVYPLLQEGLPALDAVEQAVNILEEDPTFDAGRGAFLNARGEIELDAIIMDGRTLQFGAVAAVQNILHPVSAARLIMEKTEHCFLVGKGAQEFLWAQGFPEVPPETLLTERELAFYRQIREDPHFTTRRPFDPSPQDTVGAVALDREGNLAAATSTGGTPRKMPGRVGDSPLPGAGAWADNQHGAASATGWGEAIMQVLLSRTVCDLFATQTPRKAARQAIEILHTRVNGRGGLIAITPDGEYAFHHNTRKMAFALYHPEKGVLAGIDQEHLTRFSG